MSRITPPDPNKGNVPELEDDEPYAATLEDVQWSTSSPEYGSERRLQIDWRIGEGPLDTVRDWIGLRLGRQQNGQVSKLRMLLNALAGKPSTTEIAWFDDETLEWSYDGERPFSKLGTGLPVIIEGTNGQKQDGSPKFSVNKYKKAPQASIPATTRKSKPQPAGVAAGAEDDDEEVPF